jgi:signal transduction histidine kinase/ActR/RegA family two-component response regulator
MASWSELWRSPPLEGDEASERLQTAHTLLRAGTVLIGLALLASVAMDPTPLLRHAPYALMLLVHLLALLLLRRGRLATAVIGFAALYLISVFGVMWTHGGVRAPAGFVLPPVVLLVGLTLSGRAAVWTAIAASAGLVAMVALEQAGRLPAGVVVTPVRLSIVAITTLVITGFMLRTALQVLQRSRARAAADQRARRELEERLLQARRLESIGRLAAGVAHDFNNLLTVVFAEASRLRKDERTARAGASIASAAERAAALTRQLLAFGRKQVRNPEVLDVNAVIGQVHKLLGSFLGEDVQLEVVLDPEIAPVRADRTELEQVLLNLVTNARDATPAGGTITIRTGRGDGGATLLEVVDTGAGIDPADQARLFEPFFTTKEVGKGTGLGLATVHDIVTRSGGEIRVVSVVGTGSRFTIALPAAAGAPAAVEAPRPTPVAPAGAPVIVIVDDDPAVRNAVHAVIADAGYTAKSARSPGDLLEESTGWKRAPDLILTDVVMAEIPGPELVRRLRARFPGLRALFMSGYAEDRLSERGVIASDVHFVAKPLQQAALLDKIARVLASENPGALGPGA